MSRRVLLVLPVHSYRASAFLQAAQRLGLEPVVASEEPLSLAAQGADRQLVFDLADPGAAAQQAQQFQHRRPFSAVLPADEAAVLAAAHISERLGLPGNPVPAARATRNKLRLRQLLDEFAVPQPPWQSWREGDEPPPVDYPVVVKPLDQAASRGVVRADGPRELALAGARIRAMLHPSSGCKPGGTAGELLVEAYVSGPEVAVEALLRDGRLLPVAVLDKPEPLEGPYFEETIYTLPSELPAERRAAVLEVLGAAVAAVGLRFGAIHAELRLGRGQPRLIDLASRSIGGRCSGVFRFRSGATLEEHLWTVARGEEPGSLELEEGAAGVMMLPIGTRGRLRSVEGREAALRVPGVESIEITVPPGGELVPLPEGERYLGFMFARGGSAEQVTAALQQAWSRLEVLVD